MKIRILFLISVTLLGTVPLTAQDRCAPLAQGGFFGHSNEQLHREVTSNVEDFLFSSQFKEYVKNRGDSFSANVVLPTQAGPLPLGGSAARVDEQFETLRNEFQKSKRIMNRDQVANQIYADFEANGLINAYLSCVKATQPTTGLLLDGEALDDLMIKLSLSFVSGNNGVAHISGSPLLFGVKGDQGFDALSDGTSIPPTRTFFLKREPGKIADITINTDQGPRHIQFPRPAEKFGKTEVYSLTEEENNLTQHVMRTGQEVLHDGEVVVADATLTTDKDRRLTSVTIKSSAADVVRSCRVTSQVSHGTPHALGGTIVQMFDVVLGCDGFLEVHEGDLLIAGYRFDSQVNYVNIEVRPFVVTKN